MLVSGVQARTDVTTQQAFDMIQSGEYFLLDVRTQEDWDVQGYIDGAVLIPLEELESRLSEIPTDRPILVYCHVGYKSGLASEILEDNGFTDVYNMIDGFSRWRFVDGYPVVPEFESWGLLTALVIVPATIFILKRKFK